jgi:nicotinate-nucleotide adenylyltransferase
MKIAILGGSFNPPHLGHQLIASQTLDFTKNRQIWLTPCYKHTFEKNLAPVKTRVKMTKMLENKKIKYSNEEIKAKLDGETINLMNLLKKKYPQHQFSFIIGTDNLPTFKKWGQWQKLITTTQFLVFPRPGFKYNLKKYGLNKKEYLFKKIDHPLLITCNISSTDIRKRVKQNLPIKHLVPKKIADYIKNNKLYL